MKFEVTGSIVLYKNNPEILRKAIESFLNTSLKVKLFLIDNSPSDDLRGLFEYPSVEYFFNGDNVGYGAGHNIAIRNILDVSPYHLVLNPDVSFEAGTLEQILQYMEHNGEVGLLAPKTLYPDGSLQYLCKRLPTPFDLFARRFMPGFLQRLFSKGMARYELKHLDYDQVMAVPYLSGCFMFLRTVTLKKVGLFDENIFMYLEDTDLTRRIFEFSGAVYYPKVQIVHNYEKGSYKSKKLMWYNIKSAIYYFNKWGWFFDPRRKQINSNLN